MLAVAYWLLKIVLTPLMLVLWRVRAPGARQVPLRGPAILAANHQSFCDSFFIPLVLPRRVTFVAKAEYFDDWRTAWFFHAAGQIPIRRGGGSASERALRSAAEVIKRGRLFAIYPEGTRSPDERLHKGHTGVARLALETGAQVIPVGVIGTRAVQPIGARLMRPFKRVEVRFGEPIDVRSRFGNRLGDPLVLRQATDEIMFEIARLTGQEYVDVYAKRDPAPQAGPAPQARLEPAAELPPISGNGDGRPDVRGEGALSARADGMFGARVEGQDGA